MINAQSLEATLPVIIFLGDVFRASLPEHDTPRKGRVYENATRYTRSLRDVRDVRDIQDVRDVRNV